MRKIDVKGARENNLQNIDVTILSDHLTVVTGVSGSGKSSLVFDTVYHEARRRFLDIFSLGSSVKLTPAAVESITGLGPAVAVGQNLLNRNPLSTLATASGLHPFFRLLYTNFGEQYCPTCGTGLSVLTEDEIVDKIVKKANREPITVFAPLVRQVEGSHKTLLQLLAQEFGNAVMVDGNPWKSGKLDPGGSHDIEVRIAHLSDNIAAKDVREIVEQVFALGSHAIVIRVENGEMILSRAPVCINCGTWVRTVEPKHFHTVCSHCEGAGCKFCQGTGLHPQAAAVYFFNLRLPDLLALSVDEAKTLFEKADLPQSAHRLKTEIEKRLEALQKVGLGYITLDRSSPTLSRGESQRVRLAIALTSRLEDMLHVLDEPTIGQHPHDVARLLPAFRELSGPVVFVEHDRVAASEADYAIDLGPGAGHQGGKVLFTGTPEELWRTDTPTGLYFSFREKVKIPKPRKEPHNFLILRGVNLRNLKDIDVHIPLHRLTVITGVSGSGKSTLLDVVVPSLQEKKPKECQKVEGPLLTPVLVDQSPIGRNPRSNPATYTKLSDIIRELFSAATGLSPSHFSFNRPEGRCPACKGMGAIEVQMRYLPSTWIVCEQCGGLRFSEEVLSAKVSIGDVKLSIADFYNLNIDEVLPLLIEDKRLSEKSRNHAKRILEALRDVGLGYLSLGQPSPTLSGGEAQRVKLAKYLGSRSLKNRLLILDEPSTGLHPQDISGLLIVLDRLVRAGGTVVVVEHNTDIIRAADWIVDLGPGAGPEGGELLFAGTPENLLREKKSLTGNALKSEAINLQPRTPKKAFSPSSSISICNATAHNLKGINVDIPKGALTVVTGVSGSGKSSLVADILEAEARRRFLESLSTYERQSTKEGPEAPVESISGLGVAVSVSAGRRGYSRRATIGRETEILDHLTVLLAYLGERKCEHCGTEMIRGETWICPECGVKTRIANPREFLPSNWLSACPKCQGIGTISVPNPDKLIMNPDKPLCKGAMYSPGFFPYGYMCKPPNMYYDLRALGKRYDFDPEKTGWNEMTPEAQHAFLFGDPEPMEVLYKDGKGRVRIHHRSFWGFYRLIGDWDQFGTYVDITTCPECNGATLRPEFLAVTLQGYTIHELGELPLTRLEQVIKSIQTNKNEFSLAESSYNIVLKRLHFLIQVGLGYIHLNRIAGTLSAGEAERIKLAGVLGSNLTSLTILLDEPSRGLHPSEVGALVEVLKSLRDEGNTVIVVEHDPVLIGAADYLIDLGPGAGIAGGEIVAQGTPEEVAQMDTVTGLWLRGERRTHPFRTDVQTKLVRARREPKGQMVVSGARAHNLKGETVTIPLGVLVGVCGVSGSGKSTLLIDTIGRALVPKKHTTSVAYEPIIPGEHDVIEGAPDRGICVDQTRKGVYSPLKFLNLEQPLRKVYAESEDAKALQIDEKQLKSRCSVCEGSGLIKMDMGFLPAVFSSCDACRGTGYSPEAWDVRVKGYALPALSELTIDEVYELFKDNDKIARPLKVAKEVGLGYLVLRQPAYSLSGGEAQRLKIVKELCKRTKKKSLYILDEPTLGQHLEDVERLITVLQKLVDQGHTVVVIEHHPHVLAACDWLIELGPEGGPEGGYVIAAGTPEEVAKKDTPSALYVREIVEGVL